MRTVHIDFDDLNIHIVLTRSTVSDARTRVAMWNLLKGNAREETSNSLPFFVTQILRCEGLPFEKLSVPPTPAQLETLLDAWDDLDELVANEISRVIVVLRKTPGDDQKKASDASSEDTSAAEKTLIISTMTPQNQSR